MEELDRYFQKNKYFQLRGVTAETYKQYKLQGYLKNILPKSKSAAILDIGCGLGQTLSKLREEGYVNIEGIDISEESCKCCELQKLKIKKIKSIIDYGKTSDKRYDLIIMSHVLEHVNKNEIIDTLKSIGKYLLKKDGKFCVMVPNAQANTGSYWFFEDFTHKTMFTSGSLLYVLGAAGFKKVRFLDKIGLEGFGLIVRTIRTLFLPLYYINNFFWNRITSSSYHKQSPVIFTHELRALAEGFS